MSFEGSLRAKRMKIRILLSYKGTGFCGWQKQARHRTVQAVAEKALFRLFEQSLSLTGAGRTDTGVHALGQTAHFSLSSPEKLKNIPQLKRALNRLLPPDTAVLDAWRAPENFHSRKSALKKTYLYLIGTGDSPHVLFRDMLWWRRCGPLALDILNKMSGLVTGERDFKSFQNAGSPVQNTVRRLYDMRWFGLSPCVFACRMTGSGFLKQMARNLVGTFIHLLKKPNPEQKLKDILACRDRKSALETAPGQGLYLKHVFYPATLDKACKPL